MGSKRVVMGLMANHAQADHVVEELRRAGFFDNDISILFPDKTGTRDFGHQQSTKAPEGAVAGGSAGGAVGGTLGLLVGLGALAVPGLGPFIAAGPILAAMSGAAAGAAAGGLAGGLIGLGIPEIEAKQYEGKIHGGNILISVHVNTREEQSRAKSVFERCGGSDVVTAGEQPVPASSDPQRPSFA